MQKATVCAYLEAASQSHESTGMKYCGFDEDFCIHVPTRCGVELLGQRARRCNLYRYAVLAAALVRDEENSVDREIRSFDEHHLSIHIFNHVVAMEAVASGIVFLGFLQSLVS